MSELQWLLAILGIVYLSDCAIWIPWNSFALVSFWGSKWSPTFPSAVLNNHKGGFVFVNPLPPLGIIFLCQYWPISLSPDSIGALKPQSLRKAEKPGKNTLLCNFENVNTVDGQYGDIVVNGKLFARSPSHAEALKICGLIRKVAPLAPEAREQAILNEIEKTFDVKAIRKRVEAYHSHSKFLRVFCILLWLFTFIVIPLVVWKFGLTHVILPLLGIGLLLHLCVVALYYRTHKILCPYNQFFRINQLVAMILCPPMAIRAIDAVSRNLLDTFHPLAIAWTVSGGKGGKFRKLAKNVILDLRYSISREGNTRELQVTENWYRERMITLIERFLTERGVDVKALILPEVIRDRSSQSYCPRCHCEYRVKQGECADCSGVKLVPVSSLGISQNEPDNNH